MSFLTGHEDQVIVGVGHATIGVLKDLLGTVAIAAAREELLHLLPGGRLDVKGRSVCGHSLCAYGCCFGSRRRGRLEQA